MDGRQQDPGPHPHPSWRPHPTNSRDTGDPRSCRGPVSWACPPSSSGEVAPTRTITYPPEFSVLFSSLTQLTIVGSSQPGPPEAQSRGLHPSSSLQGSVHTQVGLKAKIAASIGTQLTSANLKLQGPCSSCLFPGRGTPWRARPLLSPECYGTWRSWGSAVLAPSKPARMSTIWW